MRVRKFLYSNIQILGLFRAPDSVELSWVESGRALWTGL